MGFVRILIFQTGHAVLIFALIALVVLMSANVWILRGFTLTFVPLAIAFVLCLWTYRRVFADAPPIPASLHSWVYPLFWVVVAAVISAVTYTLRRWA